jgi:regulator of CtrA degradation
MSSGVVTLVAPSAPAGTVSFGERFVKSEQFTRIFQEGMALVERTAAYLEGEGRSSARKLAPPLSVAYTTESMRLTTRLLELASWLLIRRSLNAGQITTEEAERRRARLTLSSSGRPGHNSHFDQLPEGLRGLVEESFLLHDRIVQIDRAMANTTVAAVTDAAQNPVAAQMNQLKAAFDGTASRH